MKWAEMSDEMQVRMFWNWQAANEENMDYTFEDFNQLMIETFGDFDIYMNEEWK